MSENHWSPPQKVNLLEREIERGERSIAAAPPSFELLCAAVPNLRRAVEIVRFRLGRIVVCRRAGVGFRRQRNRRGGEDQGGNKGLEHNHLHFDVRRRSPYPASCITMHGRNPIACELAHLAY